jgi:uncharacterized protein (TIGR02145 family)
MFLKSILKKLTTKENAINAALIGKQIWMVENLNVSHFRNGDIIFEAKSNEEWQDANFKGIPAWCYYENNITNGETYGKLYNWYALIDPRELAPKDWHLPSIHEWDQLIDFLGRMSALKMKSKTLWNDNGNGLNECGFNGLPSGSRSSSGSFHSIGVRGAWWSTSSPESDDGGIWSIYLTNDGKSIGTGDFSIEGGLSVRCIKDNF